MDSPAITGDETKALFELIGFITISWGLVERAIDHLVTRTLDLGGTRLAKSGNRPYGFAEKVKYLRQAFETLPDLRRYADAALSNLEAADDFVDIRHHITHGVIESLDEGTMVVNKLKLTKAIDYQTERMEITLDSLPDMGTALLHLSQNLGAIAEQLLPLRAQRN